MGFSSNPTVVARGAAEFMRQQFKRALHWHAPVVTDDPGANQQPPMMMWIRSDLQGCERYRFYNELGEVVTLCGDQVVATTAEGDLTEVLYTFVAGDTSDDEITNTTSETWFSNKYTIPANDPDEGDIYRWRVRGRLENLSGATVEVKIRVYMGAVRVQEINSGVFPGGNPAPGIAIIGTADNTQWWFEVDVGFNDTSGSGSCHVHGLWAVRRETASPPDLLYKRQWGQGGSGSSYFAPSPCDMRVSVIFSQADPDIKAQLVMMSVERLRIV